MDEQTNHAPAAEPATAVTAQRSLLARLEIVVFWLVVAPLAALLPARLAYWVACRRGDWEFRHWPAGTAIVKRNLLQVFGETLSPAEAERLARELSRTGSCEVIDIMRLRNGARPLRKLVEFRGREHLEAAMAARQGGDTVLCALRLLLKRLLLDPRQRYPGYRDRTLVVELRSQCVSRRTAVLGLRLCPAPAALPAGPEYRAVDGPDHVRRAGNSHAPP